MKITRVFRLLVPAFVLLSSTTLNAQPTQSSDLARSQELNSTVLKLFSAGQYAEALPPAREALQLRERALGSEHEDLIPLITNLGEVRRANTIKIAQGLGSRCLSSGCAKQDGRSLESAASRCRAIGPRCRNQWRRS